jgi:ribosome biogenesis protein ENP2
MHGYFISLKLYDAARVIANPYVYEEHRAKMVQQKLDKLAEGRIRTRKDQVKVKVNKSLAEKIAREEERTKRREERKRKKDVEDGDDAASAMDIDADVDVDEAPAVKQKPSLLSDARFAALFEDPEFEVDEESREFALLNPSAAAQKKGRVPEGEGRGWGRGKTAVEDEEEESDKASSDGLNESEESSGSEDEQEHGAESEDSSEAGGLSNLLSTHIRISCMYKPPSQISSCPGNHPPPHAAQRTRTCVSSLCNINRRRVPAALAVRQRARTLPSATVDPPQRDSASDKVT